MKKSKFNAKKTACNYCDKLHDSKKEAMRCNELHEMEKSGEIRDLMVQPNFTLLPSHTYRTSRGKRMEREIKYIADFKYWQGGVIVVEDVKSKATKKLPEYIIKRKLFQWIFCKDGDVEFFENVR
ncbi:DUF1064 domain-containing protein [uncultured Ruminococcus sp.]|uniref:DUF1064 domain-containing protein n=1 Tax=uncultured Ruminococcus sp. TaxID=165186 RepID=UPI002637FC12|nr:DUF1064 domain-containing protein [uncultured Ruminococcus sp.]